MEKFLYPNHPVRCIITGPSECGKSVFFTNLILYNINQYDKRYFYSPSPHRDLYQKLINCFSIYIPIDIIHNILNEKDMDVVFQEILNKKDCEKSDIEIETFENLEEIKYTQGYNSDQSIVNTLDDLNQKEMDDPHVQAMLERLRHIDVSVFIISQDYSELSKKTIRCDGII